MTTPSPEAFKAMGYKARAALHDDDPAAYAELAAQEHAKPYGALTYRERADLFSSDRAAYDEAEGSVR